MDPLTGNLLLHLPLDEMFDDTVFDVSGNRRNGLLNDAQIVSDPGFGPCLELRERAGSYVEVSALEPGVDFELGMTIAAWIKCTEAEASGCLLALGDQAGNDTLQLYVNLSMPDMALFLTASIAPRQIQPADQGAAVTVLPGSASAMYLPAMLPIDSWFHLALVIAPNGRIALYLNGQSSWSGESLLPRRFEGSTIVLGGKGQSQPPASRVSNLRIYTRALEPDELIWDMEEDSPPRYRYRITHPLSFSLENGDAQPVLYMTDDPNGQELTLTISNTARHPIRFQPLSPDPPGAANHHLMLRFRPGSLADGSLDAIGVAAPQGGWRVKAYPGSQPDEPDAIYLVCDSAAVLPAAGLALRLGHLVANLRYGTRGTVVEFHYHNMQLESGEMVAGSYEHALEIVNHRGRREIPLHVGFVGPNTVLTNNPRTDRLRLRVTNLLPQTDPLQVAAGATTGSIRFDNDSRLIVAFDDRADADWRLGEPNAVGEIDVSYAKAGTADQDPTTWPKAVRTAGLGTTWQWTLSLTDMTLASGEYIELVCDNIKASGPDGHTNLYLNYKNIPGYWDGRFVCVIEKAPLVYRNGKVGIGTLPQQARLEVAQDSGLAIRVEPAAGNATFIGRSEENSLQFDYAGGQALNSTASLSFNIDTNNDDKARYVDFRANGKGFGGGSSLLRITEDGNVGIGATAPGARLSVIGGAHIGGTADPGASNLLVDGNLGVGASQFENKYGWNRIVDIVGQQHARLNVRSSGGVITGVFSHDDWSGARGVIGTESNHPLTFATNYAHRMIIDTSGRVGIGTAAPQSLLHVGSARRVEGNSDGQIIIGKNDGLASQGSNPGSGISANPLYRPAAQPAAGPPARPNSRMFRIGMNGDYNLTVGDYGSDVGVSDRPYMTIRWSDGWVGIGAGASGPQAQLDVDGDMVVRGALKGAYQETRSGIQGAQATYIKQVSEQKAAVIQGFGLSATYDPKYAKPHLFALGYYNEGTTHQTAAIFNLTTGAVSSFKTFIIDHPQRPDRYLVHATLEGPEGAVYYRGSARLERGRARVQLPGYFEALTRPEGRTILLTNLDGFDQLAVLQQDGAKIRDGVFVVASANPDSRQAFDWEVKAIRRDVPALEPEPARRDLAVERFGPYTYGVPRPNAGEEGA